MGKLSRAAWLYIGTVVAVAAFVVAHSPPTGISWSQLGVLAVLLLACESVPTSIMPRRITWSPGYAATLASVVLLGPAGAAIVGVVCAFTLRRGPTIPQRVFNGAMYALSAHAAGQVFLALGGTVGVPAGDSFPVIIGPFAAAAAAHIAANYGLLAGVLWLTRGPDRRQRGLHGIVDLRLPLPDFGYAFFGLLIAAIWSVVGPFAAILVLIPLFVARWAIAQFADQQRAYEATLRVLCQAVETKDYYTRGHSERVSKGSVMIASAIGMRPERVEAIRYAGMLHDVGKLGVPTKVLQKTGKLTEEEYAAIQLHPMRGLEIIREIGFLDEALAGIMHHHERIDGRGYPMGLAGDEIPEFARVLAVADAFDCMTSTRSYRGARTVCEAIAELRRCSGTQFDPAFVDALVAAVEREGWQTPDVPVPPPGEEVTAAAYDHDDPVVPLRVVGSR
ncbi:MAG TPA: HD-GYP domain-containing protein [Streptosporangiaceae bacterium]|nr:HD-GYP domain-containing protein [Streptosporangiaceae bacterium]